MGVSEALGLGKSGHVTIFKAPSACSPPTPDGPTAWCGGSGESFRHWSADNLGALPILEEGDEQTLAPLPTAQPHCQSPSSACWRTTTSTGALPVSCCPWAPPSTWTAPHSTRLWPPSSLPRSTTMIWTSARSSPSGALPTPCTQCGLGRGVPWNGLQESRAPRSHGVSEAQRGQGAYSRPHSKPVLGLKRDLAP